MYSGKDKEQQNVVVRYRSNDKVLHLTQMPHSRRRVAGKEQSEASLSRYCLSPASFPLTFPSVEKLSSTTPVPGAKKVGDHWIE